MKICVEVPATSANCCVGFDCLGMALDEIASFHFEKSDRLIITGCPEQFQNEDNLVVQAFRHACSAYGVDMPPFRLHIDSDIPFARGLGSSSTCIVAGLMGANLMMSLGMKKEQILILATEMEGHPDNAAPAILGQMCACFMKDGRIIHTQIDCSKFKALAIIPPYEVSTPMARKVLPSTLDFTEAVHQTGHALVFERAISTGNEELLFESCEDVLHEPYRKKLIPEYEHVSQICRMLETPFWISGSGSTMLVLSKHKAKLRKIQELLQEKYKSFDIRLLEINSLGALAYYE
ncbi:MAG: homoserine kinase [Erysipelotrichaceae bacterium]|nr:homoserine kinase [Erysipelotrichaceae bacterium]